MGRGAREATLVVGHEMCGEVVDQRLWANAARFKEAMAGAGFDLGGSQTPITPVILGEASLAQEFSRRLFDGEAVFAQAIGYPTVPTRPCLKERRGPG